MDNYENPYPEAIQVLEDSLEDSLQFYSFKQMDHRKISSTNMLEMLNQRSEDEPTRWSYSPIRIPTSAW